MVINYTPREKISDIQKECDQKKKKNQQKSSLVWEQ